MDMLTMFFWLLVGHALADYPFQGDFLARGKHPVIGFPEFPWQQALFWHSLIHAGAVALVTGSVLLGLCELLAHLWIDYWKCMGAFGVGRRSIHIDQGLHVACKAVWSMVVFVGASI